MEITPALFLASGQRASGEPAKTYIRGVVMTPLFWYNLEKYYWI
tara:strand:+ start:739 stop:870 length:132 start_codon:yes stop_codon:yes gene_type:complete